MGQIRTAVNDLKIDERWNRGVWEAEEDNLLQKAVEHHGKKYGVVHRL